MPYAYRLATRYLEIPCRISGTITVDGEALTIINAVGQRDHSMGSPRLVVHGAGSPMAGHLTDGTHLHASQVRLPDGQRLAVGYVQRPGARWRNSTEWRPPSSWTRTD